MDWGVIFATLAGPVLAIQVQKLLERKAEKKRRKEWVFYTLMSLRAARLSADFVRALNTIDFAFSAGNPSQSAGEREVIRKWRDYLAHVANPPPDGNWVPWNMRINDLVVDLLQAMADDLKYPFERETIRSGGYATQASAEHENELAQVRRSLARILEGQQALPVVNMTPGPDGKLVPMQFPAA